MKKIILVAVAIIAVAVAAVFSFNKESFPEVSYHTLEGKQLTTQDLKGKVVLVKFWATTCVTCVKQMPDTIKHYNTYKDKGFDTIAVAMSYDDPQAIIQFRDSHQLPFTIAYDKTGEIAKAVGGVRFTPVAFLVDRQGNIVKRYIGDYDEKEFVQTLEKTLAQQ